MASAFPSNAMVLPAVVGPRAAMARPWHDADAPAAATGRLLLGTVWQRLLDGAIECIDVHFRSGHVITDLIGLRVHGSIAEGTQIRGRWTHAFALDDIAFVRGVDFGRMR